MTARSASATAPLSAVLDAVRTVVGPLGWVGEDSDMEPYLREERGLFHGSCLAVVRPASAGELAEVVRLCAAAGLPMVAQGGNTGLVGGGVPGGGVVLSTSRLNRILDLDPVDRTITVEAGVILAEVQAAADEAGLLFPLSLGAEGSCRIGGNLATNAGGMTVIRYGNARELVLGLEVVLADGRVWNGLRTLRKDNTGYDLKQLFLGSEGTLGIITAAVLKLFPRPRTSVTAMAAVPTVAAALRLLTRLQDTCGDSLTAYEFMGRRSIEFCLRHVPGILDPFAEPHPVYVLVLATSPRADPTLQRAVEDGLADALDAGEVIDAVLAQSEAQARDLWRIRHAIPEGQKPEGASIKNDVAVPVSRVPEFMEQATAAVEAALPGIRVCAFGHLGDGNVHFNLSQPEGADPAAFLAKWDRFDRIVSDIAVGLGGSFSAEHGVGRLKHADMRRYKSEVELSMMRAVKAALDPAGVLNPGKVLT
jgi:D-lactate dehydrogenase (cytochrome)